MTRKQQAIALFLSLVLILVFALNEIMSPKTLLFRGPLQQNPLLEGPGPRSHGHMEQEALQGGFSRSQARSNFLETREKKERGAQGQSWPHEDPGPRVSQDLSSQVGEPPHGKMLENAGLSPIQKMILSIPININTAPIEELDALPGVGPRTAQAIIDFRARFGPFQSPEDLMKVRGIGPKKFSALRPHITLQ